MLNCKVHLKLICSPSLFFVKDNAIMLNIDREVMMITELLKIIEIQSAGVDVTPFFSAMLPCMTPKMNGALVLMDTVRIHWDTW